MKTQTIEYQDEHLTARITLSEATVLIGMKRTRLRLEAEPDKEADPDKRILRLFTYPDLLAATTEITLIPADGEGKYICPPDFDTFILLPEELATAWEQATYALNPHWLPGSEKEAKKKATISTGG